MPLRATKGSAYSDFVYGADHQRLRQARSDGTVTYYAGAMEAEVQGGTTAINTCWPLGLGVEIERNGTTALNWTHLDRLGSVVAITDETATVKEQLAYDSWGNRRDLTTVGTPSTLDGVVDNKGFTGHETLDQIDLVHMNGRIYDPLLARFMSADPLIQEPTHGQSYNRYTYVWNNPTNLTDPTGFAANARPNPFRDNPWRRLAFPSDNGDKPKPPDEGMRGTVRQTVKRDSWQKFWIFFLALSVKPIVKRWAVFIKVRVLRHHFSRIQAIRSKML